MIFERGHFNNSIILESAIDDAMRQSRSPSYSFSQSNKPTVFLSHKHDDLRDLRGFMGKLQQLGVHVYIDSMDNKMPEQTSSETARRIKGVIKSSNKFIFLATEKAIESYWCNWELGIGDALKYDGHIAILPMKDTGKYDHQYKGNEYLEIYPHIDYQDGTLRYNTGNIIPMGYYVRDPINSRRTVNLTLLKDWLHNT